MAIISTLALLTVSAAGARESAAVWFAPDPDTPDFTDLFTKPQLWPKARQRVDVFLVGPNQTFSRADLTNDLATLQGVDAYRKMQQWNMDIAIDAPSIKPWDCTGQGDRAKDPRATGNAKVETLRYIKNVFTAGAHAKYIAMDEPFLSGVAVEFCHEMMDQVAAKTAAYVKALLADPNLPTWAPGLAVGDIEVYPRMTPDQLIRWTRALEQNAYKPAFFHLDVAVKYLEVHPEINFNRDIRALQSFFKTQGIPFGIIFWSGHDPEPTDASYYNHVVSWAQRVHAAIGAPEQSIIQSWVPRSSIKCTAGVVCNPANRFMCSPADPPYCGKLSVPINLPENNPSVFSHTRLINTVTEILHGR